MKLRNLPLILGLALPISSEASVVVASNLSSSAGNSVPILNTSGNLIPAGSGVIAVGYFTTTTDAQLVSFDSSPTQAIWSALLADFSRFGSTLAMGAGTGSTPRDGLFKSGSAQSSTVTPGSSFDGKSIYVLVGNNSTLEASTQGLIFKSNDSFVVDTAGSASADLFKTGGNSDGTFLVAGDTVSRVFFTSGPAAINNVELAGIKLVDIVPEPMSLTACALGGLVFFRRRR